MIDDFFDTGQFEFTLERSFLAHDLIVELMSNLS
jgi:hypothetical protein